MSDQYESLVAAHERVPMPMHPDVVIALTDYMNDSVDALNTWFKRTPSNDPDKYKVASIIATSEKPAHLSRAPDLPFIRFYLYKMNETTAKMSESQFNQILTIDKDHFHIRSGVDKLFGGDRTKHCSIILDIEDMLKHLGVGYTMSDQAKECRKQPPSSHQELDSMKADARYLHLGEGAFGADDDYFILNSAGPADLPLAGPLPPFVARDLKSSKQMTKIHENMAGKKEIQRLDGARASALSDLKSSSRVSLLEGNALADELNKHMAAGSKKAMKSRRARKSKKAMKSRKARKARKSRKAMNTRKSA